MSQENTITLRGFVTAEPKLWQPTPAHTPVTEIRVGSTPRRLNRTTGEWEDGDTIRENKLCLFLTLGSHRPGISRRYAARRK